MDVGQANGGNIVIVDDNPNNLRVLGDMLRQAGLKVRPALSGQLALRSIAANPPDLILLDIRMPDLDGYEVCRRLKDNPNTQNIPVIFISALHETEDKIAAFHVGGVDYIAKPFHVEEVLARVKTHLQLHHMQQKLEAMVAERTEELKRTYEAIREREVQHHRMLEQTIQVIAMTIEKRDPYTSGHQQRVARLAQAIAQKIGLDKDRILGLTFGATIHDIGKIYLPAEILNRPGRLSDLEYDLIKTHSQVGYDIVKDVDFPWPVAEMILQHHERMDGSGYPRSLKGEEILLEAQILSVCDVAEAMATHRPYRAALGLDKAVEELRKGQGTRYASPMVDALCSLIDEGKIQQEQHGVLVQDKNLIGDQLGLLL